jgi:hypothetical protein
VAGAGAPRTDQGQRRIGLHRGLAAQHWCRRGIEQFLGSAFDRQGNLRREDWRSFVRGDLNGRARSGRQQGGEHLPRPLARCAHRFSVPWPDRRFAQKNPLLMRRSAPTFRQRANTLFPKRLLAPFS